MRIEGIGLRNIRSYEDAYIPFPSGRILLSGDIGSGKSTVLIALEFALFGLVKGWNDGEKLLRHGANQGSVSLVAHIDGTPIRITRSLKRSSRGIQQENVYLRVGTDERSITPSEARAQILTLLKYPEEFVTRQPVLFRYTIFTPQEAMKEIVSERADVRLDLIRKIFGIDRYQQVLENGQTIARELKTKSVEFSGRLARKSSLIEEITAIDLKRKQAEKRIASIAGELETATKAAAEAEQAFETVKEQRSREKLILDQLKEARSRRKELTARTESIEKRIAELSKDTETPSDPEKTRSRLEEITQTLTQAKESLRKLEEEREAKRTESSSVGELASKLAERLESSSERDSQFETEARDATLAIGELREQLQAYASFDESKVTEELKALQEREAKLREEIGGWDREAAAAREVSERISDLVECTLCHQPIDDGHRKHVLADAEKRIETAKTKRTQSSAMLGELAQKIEQAQSKLSRYAIAKERQAQLTQLEEKRSNATKKREKEREQREQLAKNLTQARERKASLDTAILELDTRIKAEKERTTALEAEREKLQAERLAHAEREKRKAERENLTSQLETCKAETLQIDERIEKLTAQGTGDGIEERYKTAEAAHRTARERVQALERTRIEAQGQLTHLSEEREKRTAELKALTVLERRKGEYDSAISFLQGPFPDLVRSIEQAVMNRILVECNEYFQKWFSMLVDDIEVYLDESFTPIVNQSGYEIDYANLSGGERTAVALAYRLALHEAINEILTHSSNSLLILDEPTEGFSTEQLDAVRSVLDQLRSEQIILVSHESKVESFVDSIIRVEKRSGLSGILE